MRKARELAYRDLGGLVFNLHRFGQRNDALVIAKLSTLGHIDTELRSLEGALGERQPMTVLREAGITACPRCAALHSGEDHFCPNCGLPVSRRVDLPIAGAPAAAPRRSRDRDAERRGGRRPATAASPPPATGFPAPTGPPTVVGPPTSAGPASGAGTPSGPGGARAPSPAIPTPVPARPVAEPATAVHPGTQPATAGSPSRDPGHDSDPAGPGAG